VTLALLATGALGVAGFAAASAGAHGTARAADPVKLTIWVGWSQRELSVFKKVVAEYDQKHPELTVSVVGGINDNKIVAAIRAGNAPDIVSSFNSYNVGTYCGSGAWVDLDPLLKQDHIDPNGFPAATRYYTQYNGKRCALPLLADTYGLYYNKKLFKDAGIAGPPATWADLVADGKKLTAKGKSGLAIEGANNAENIHHAYIFAKQHGGDFFDASGNPTFTSPGAVAGVKQFVDFMATDKIIKPGDAEYAQNQSLQDFATGKVGMLLWQAAGVQLAQRGMKAEDWGVAPVPVQSGAPGQGAQVNTMVAGINLAVFKNTQNRDGALKFVKFMTSDEEQKILNGKYGSIPPVSAAQSDPQFSNPEQAVLRQGLAKSAVALPQVPKESQFEDLVGDAMKDLFADAAAGRSITDQSVQKRLEKAQQQMTG
jgi:multiple sugar transport system substrate-binding protein